MIRNTKLSLSFFMGSSRFSHFYVQPLISKSAYNLSLMKYSGSLQWINVVFIWCWFRIAMCDVTSNVTSEWKINKSIWRISLHVWYCTVIIRGIDLLLRCSLRASVNISACISMTEITFKQCLEISTLVFLGGIVTKRCPHM